MDNVILYGHEARKRVQLGIDKTANAVKPTLGARGRNVMLVTQRGGSQITKDGVTVARNIMLEDPIERAGSDLVKEVAFKTVVEVGDGTSSASVLFQSLVTTAMKFMDESSGEKKVNVTELNRGIVIGAKFVLDYIKGKSRPVGEDAALLRRIAIISCNNDERLGTTISKAVSAVGKEGKVSIVESATPDTSYTIVKGMQYGRGVLSNDFITDERRNLAILEKPYILISERPLLEMKPLAPILDCIVSKNIAEKVKRPLLIIAPEVDMQALAVLTTNHNKGVLQMCAVQCPGQGMSMEDYTTDLAIYTGATIISEERNIPLDQTTMEHLGSADRVEVGKSNIVIIGGGGDKEAIDVRIDSIKSLLEETQDQKAQQDYKDRIASISCSIGILSVGAGSVSELKEKIDRVDDAVRACRAAMEEGYVAGAGATFYGATFEIPIQDTLIIDFYNLHNTAPYADPKAKMPKVPKSTDYEKGLFCVHQAIQAVGNQLYENAGSPTSSSGIPAVIYQREYGKGYDAMKGEICNLFERGIIDPTKVLTVSLQNAVSVATTFLTTEVVSFVK